jgi:hypothetical protein
LFAEARDQARKAAEKNNKNNKILMIGMISPASAIYQLSIDGFILRDILQYAKVPAATDCKITF